MKQVIIFLKKKKSFLFQLLLLILCLVFIPKFPPNGHTTSNPRISRTFFRRDFDVQKTHLVSMYSCRCNFDGRKIHVISTYFYWCNFAGPKSTLFPRTFFDIICQVKYARCFYLLSST